jgi:hypothetical protein
VGVLVELEHRRDRPVEEGPVVGDDDHAARHLVDEEPLEPVEAGEVEVVRRLVEQQHVEPGQQHGGERGPGRLAPGERDGVLVERPLGQAQVRAHDGGPRVEVGAAERHPPLQRGRVRVVGAGRAFGHVGGGTRHRQLGLGPAGPPGELGPEGLPRPAFWLLREVADGGARRRALDGAGVGLHEPGEHLQERGLAHAVGTDDAHAAPGADGQVDRVEDDRGAPVDGDAPGDERGGGGGRHGPPTLLS